MYLTCIWGQRKAEKENFCIINFPLDNYAHNSPSDLYNLKIHFYVCVTVRWEAFAWKDIIKCDNLARSSSIIFILSVNLKSVFLFYGTFRDHFVYFFLVIRPFFTLLIVAFVFIFVGFFFFFRSSYFPNNWSNKSVDAVPQSERCSELLLLLFFFSISRSIAGALLGPFPCFLWRLLRFVFGSSVNILYSGTSPLAIQPMAMEKENNYYYNWLIWVWKWKILTLSMRIHFYTYFWPIQLYVAHLPHAWMEQNSSYNWCSLYLPNMLGECHVLAFENLEWTQTDWILSHLQFEAKSFTRIIVNIFHEKVTPHLLPAIASNVTVIINYALLIV